MKGTKLKWKKAIALTLAFNMIVGLFPAMPNAMATVQAEEGTGSSIGRKPSVTAFATKDELMTKFDLDGSTDADGNIDDTVGKLVFGKNSSQQAQEWYILGQDNDVTDANGNATDNIVIFAASDIATGQMFNASTSNKTDSILWNDWIYPEESVVTEVYANHYGASDLRVALKNMEEDTNYFTETEQSLMNETTVKTYDNLKGVDYTTTDILYALKGDAKDGNDKNLWAGSDDSKAIAMNPYWNSGEYFWLRTPYQKSNALVADQGRFVNSAFWVKAALAVRPAANLNLSDVLFSSAASSLSADSSSSSDTEMAGTIESEKAMTLRLDGSTKAIGSVVYNTENGQILAQKDRNAEENTTVSLVVQGNDGTKNWYYSKVIDGTAEISTEDIKNAFSDESTETTLSNISLADCEIWMEITEDNVTYAKIATEANVTSVTPTLPVNDTFAEYYIEETKSPYTELGTQVTVNFEGGHTILMDVDWSVANEDESEYDPTPGKSNTFKWKVKENATGYKFVANSEFEKGTVNITNRAYTDVTITPKNATVSYNGTTIDVSQCFEIDSNAGKPTYTIESNTGESNRGEETLSGNTLTVTKTGDFVIKVNTATNGIYGAGEATAKLTVEKGTITSSATGYTGTYDGKAHGIAVTVESPADTKITYSTDGTNYRETNPQFTDKGNYTVYYKIEKENYNTVEGSQTVTITEDNATTANGYTIVEVEEQNITSANTDKGDVEGSTFAIFQLKATGKKNSVKLTWKKVKDADGYIIYGAKCSKSLKKITTLQGNKKVSYTQKKLKKATYYKYIVVAYKNIDGQSCVIATSKSAHAVTTGGKYANPTKVTVKKAKMTIKKGKKQTIKASITLPKGKKTKTHIAKFRYESSNTKVATVSKKGVVTGKKKGTAYIYVYAQNGVYKKVKVIVK